MTKRKEHIVTYTLDEIKKMKSRTDSRRVQNTSEKQIAEQADKDPDVALLTDEELAEFRLATTKKGKSK
ncbi:MAG: hypothetical protein HY308_15675 [Gammaproteobacteria bacterium]|nr:hypothetical protein [Gammaproteobacteria bacterium]